MPAELLDAPVSHELSPKSVIREVRKFLPDWVVDEFKNTEVDGLKPRPITIENRPGLAEEFNEQLERDFAYYSRTHDLEINSERTKMIQGVADRLTEGSGIQTRVVIMRKSRELQAFVVPDGTIFISQSLMNRLDSMDEIAGVLAHEVGHLINKTSVVSAEVGIGRFGVGWLHEEACDQKNAPELLEKAGFRTWAFGTSILKIQGYGRGTIHQSGLARASQTVGGHMAIDRTTSNQVEISIPKQLYGKFSRTNLEIVMDKIQERLSIEKLLGWYQNARNISVGLKKTVVEALTPLNPFLEKLHPRDFGAVYRHLINKRDNRFAFADKQVCDLLIQTRLKTAGYSEDEIRLFLVWNLPGRYDYGADLISQKDAYMFKDPKDLEVVVSILEQFEDQDLAESFKEMHEDLFDTGRAESPTMQLLKLMKESIYDVDVEKFEQGLPVTREILLSSLEKISQIDSEHMSGYLSDEIGGILSRYVYRTFLFMATEAGVEIDEGQIRDFFQEVKDRNIKISAFGVLEEFKRPGGFTITRELISPQNREKVVEVFKQVFEIETAFLTTEKIDQFFVEFTKEGLNDKNRLSILEKFLKTAQEYLNTNNISVEQRIFFARYLGQKIENASFLSDIDLLDALKNGFRSGEKSEEKDRFSNDAIRKFNLLMIVGATFFKEDSAEFYTFVEEAMRKVSPYVGGLLGVELISLCQTLFVPKQRSHRLYLIGQHPIQDFYTNMHLFGLQVVSLKDYDRFFTLPLVRRISELEEKVDFQDLGKLNSYISSIFYKLNIPFAIGSGDKVSLYGDSLLSLVVGKSMRENFEKLLRQGIQEKDFDELYNFLNNNYPEGPQKDAFLREINKLCIKSPNIALEQKIEYMLRFFDAVGPEAMVIIAEQIEDIETYRYFREKLGARLTVYLEGKEPVAVTKIAAADFLGSSLVKEFEELLATCQDNEAVKEEISTELAADWFVRALSDHSKNIVYDDNLGKFVLTEAGRTIYRTLTDSFSTLKNFTDLQKFALIHKSLTDTNGALTSRENRQKLANLLIRSLRFEKGFISSVLQAACSEADAKLLGFPVSIMLVPLLFRALNVKAVNVDKLIKARNIYTEKGTLKLDQILSRQAILDIMSADTRSVSVFGVRYASQPQSPAALLAGESDQQFTSTTELLNKFLNFEESGASGLETKAGGSEVDPAIEAVIRGVETSGALGIRALQLATQFHTFPPALERRLSDTLDSNPGLNKLLFWENLHKLAEGDEEIRQYLQRITLGDYLGGGSLQTTYAATLDAGTLNERQVIVKMKNPNVDTFVKESYISAHKTLEVVSRQRGASGQHAKTGMVLMDLAQNWCLDDLNDKTFLYDDEQFRHVIGQFNARIGAEIFYAPVKLFTASKLKSETLAPGKTANQFLNDQSISFEQKQEVVRTLSRFFIHQLKGEPVVDAGGQRYHLVHSDPHVGNYMVDVSGAVPRIGVIDRSMYLKLQEADIKVLEKLAVSGNDNEFVYGFIDRVLDINKVRGVQRTITRGRVFAGVGAEYVKQRTRGKIDRFSLMRVMLSTLSDAKVDVPLELRLMIRNIGAFQELGRRYGVDFEALYKEAA